MSGNVTWLMYELVFMSEVVELQLNKLENMR